MRFIALVVHLDFSVEPEIQPVPALLGKLHRVLPAQDVILHPLTGGFYQARRNGGGPEILHPIFKLELLVLETVVCIVVIDDYVADNLELQVSLFHDGRVDLHVSQVGPHDVGRDGKRHGQEIREIPYNWKHHVLSG